MEIPREDGIRLISELWINKYPCTQKYFGEYLGKLLLDLENGKFRNAQEYFTKLAFYPKNFEKRLGKILETNQTIISEIIGEIGSSNQPPIELDRRLMNAWAEIRFISQLQEEGFSNIEKNEKFVDFTAEKDGNLYGFQVTRICTNLDNIKSKHISRKTKARILTENDFHVFDTLPNDIYKAWGPVIKNYFHRSIKEKNSDLKKWKGSGTRCIVIVTSEENLQDSMLRHIACQQIRESIKSLVPALHFEELVWLPDLSSGAWFKIYTVPSGIEIKCYADWQDDGIDRPLNREEIDLDSLIP